MELPPLQSPCESPFTWEGPMGSLEGLPDVSCHTVEGTGSRGQAVLREGKGQDTLELQHCPTRVISLHLGNSPGIQLGEQKGCSLKCKKPCSRV